jgi:predicted Fe-S protein YdhL (DUF1289 family)
MRDPEIFAGDDPEAYPPWQCRMLYKLQQDPELFPTETDVCSYITTRTTGFAWDLINVRGRMNSSNPYKTAKELWADMDRTFGTDLTRAQAIAQLFSSAARQQKDESVAWFTVRLDEIMLPLKMDDETRQEVLKYYCKEDIRRQATHLHPPSYQELVRALQRIETDFILFPPTRNNRSNKTYSTQGNRRQSGNSRAVMDQTFGTGWTRAQAIAQLFSSAARQQKDESVAQFAFRLNKIMLPLKMDDETRQEVLKYCCKKDIRRQAIHLHPPSYQELVRALQLIETDFILFSPTRNNRSNETYSTQSNQRQSGNNKAHSNNKNVCRQRRSGPDYTPS